MKHCVKGYLSLVLGQSALDSASRVVLQICESKHVNALFKNTPVATNSFKVKAKVLTVTFRCLCDLAARYPPVLIYCSPSHSLHGSHTDKLAAPQSHHILSPRACALTVPSV